MANMLHILRDRLRLAEGSLAEANNDLIEDNRASAASWLMSVQDDLTAVTTREMLTDALSDAARASISSDVARLKGQLADAWKRLNEASEEAARLEAEDA